MADPTGERAAAVADLALALAASGSTTSLLQREVVRRAASLLRDASGLWQRDDHGRLGLVALSHWRSEVRAYMQARADQPNAHDAAGPLEHVWRQGVPLRLDAAQAASWLPRMHPVYQQYADRFGLGGLLVVPLRARGSVVGLLGVWRDRGAAYSDDDQAFMQQVAAVAAVALDNDRLLRQVQQHLAHEQRASRAAHRAALHDALTGLANRRLLLERLQAATARDQDELLVALLDLDAFKVVNDALGHAAGDAALVEVADRLRRAVGEHAPGPRTTLARLGGDEFAVLTSLPADRGERLAEALTAAAAAPLQLAGTEVRLGASTGLARARAAEARTLLRRADIAMYRAKREGRAWAHWSPELDAAAEQRLAEIARLDEALAHGGLVVHYQPLVPRARAARQAPAHVEALVRWQHPERGLLAPAQFLPLVEASGRAGALTRAVLRTAVRDAARWRQLGRQVQVAVNVDAAVLADPGLLPLAQQLLEDAGLPPSALCLELVESALLSPEGPGLLHRARTVGLSVALDDFGTGWSSLAYLADLALDRLKLDMSFVRRLGQGQRSSRFVAGLVGIVQDLGLPVVAEGVETEQDVARLDALGVEYQQGFFHARPAPWAAVAWPTDDVRS